MSIIRPSRADDITAITAIYAQHVLGGTGTFEIDPPSVQDMAARRAEVLARNLPYLVAEAEARVVGFAYCNWFKPRPAYRFSAEDSVYVEAGHHRTGIGRALLAELLAAAERAGVRQLIAVIGDSANAGSIGLHRAVGFEPAGVLKACGWKFDQWLDVVMMQRSLGPGHTAAPRDIQP
jgi:L-amino acid N-acyltransferase YncA